MKLQHIAAAVALAAVGSANAAIATGGNGSMVLIAYDKLGGTTTAGVFDLGLTLDDFVGSTGNGTALSSTALHTKNISWDLVNNTITVGGSVTSFGGSNNWTAAWNTLLANSDAADLSFVVTAFDTVGIAANQRSLVTGSPTSTATFLSGQASGLQAIAGGKPQDIFQPLTSKGTIASAANGAYTFTAADGAATRANGYAMAGDAFGNEWRSNNVLGGETLASKSTALYLVDGATKKAIAGGAATPGVLRLDASTGVLSYTVSAVPEPSTYAMLVAGLVVAGAAARRRRAA